MKKFEFKTNINCKGCLAAVTPALNKVPHLSNWEVDLQHPDRILTVETTDDNREAVVKAVENAGFNISHK